jgi:tetratricopeptide (TPR) repeat protein
MSLKHNEVIWVLSGILILCSFVALMTKDGIAKITAVRLETVQYFSPTEKNAETLGDMYLDATYHPSLYDRDRAYYFFMQALRLDPNQPGVRHQLARVAFLNGNFGSALWYIDHEISLPGHSPIPSSYYVRGLIEGYSGDYADAAHDYETYLQTDPSNWAAMNDYAWVLLKASRYEDAYSLTKRGLDLWPHNPWLLNSAAIALFELHKPLASAYSMQAVQNVRQVTAAEWRTAYPGNDPAIAADGIEALMEAVIHNDARIRAGTVL